MRPLKIAPGIVAAIALAACGSSAAPSAGAIGKTAQVGSIKLTLKQFNDPAHGSSEQLPRGERYVAIRFGMSNPTSQTQLVNSGDVAVLGSNDRIYPDYNQSSVSVTGCPNFDSFGDGYGINWNVGSHATVSNCTVFMVPDGVKVRKIIWGLGGQFSPLDSTTLLWTISHTAQ